MGRFVSSSSRLPFDSIREPNLRLVSRDRVPALVSTRVSEESAKTAVMACLSARSFGNREMLLKASAAARKHGGEFYAALIDSPHTRFGTAQGRTLIDDAILAGSLGAKIVRLDSYDIVGELLNFARHSHIGRIFVARNRLASFPRLLARTVYSDLLSRAEGIRIDVVGFERGN